ncbi:hypothetical protein DIE00_03320 [Burkholderia sp. Bp8989]|nr:hypothetical protein DIE05_20680 [Burkholderia sp. Bp8995]RQS51761.1 hypothetical protein DIE00_03320 [Burkholderia sp. Bp8989]
MKQYCRSGHVAPDAKLAVIIGADVCRSCDSPPAHNLCGSYRSCRVRYSAFSHIPDAARVLPLVGAGPVGRPIKALRGFQWSSLVDPYRTMVAARRRGRFLDA